MFCYKDGSKHVTKALKRRQRCDCEPLQSTKRALLLHALSQSKLSIDPRKLKR